MNQELSSKAQEAIKHLRNIGFTSDEEVFLAARVLKTVRDEPGMHYWRFNLSLRNICDRLIKLELIDMDADKNLNLR